MPELRLDGLHAGALSDEQTRAGVPEVIETQLFRQQRRTLVLGQLDHRLVGGTDSRPEDELDEIGRLSGPPMGAVDTSASRSCGRPTSEAATSSATERGNRTARASWVFTGPRVLID